MLLRKYPYFNERAKLVKIRKPGIKAIPVDYTCVVNVIRPGLIIFMIFNLTFFRVNKYCKKHEDEAVV